MHIVSFKVTLPEIPDRSGLALVLGDPAAVLNHWQEEVNERADALDVPPAVVTFTAVHPATPEEVELTRLAGLTVHQFAEPTSGLV